MSNLGKKYQRRGGRAPRLTQALEVAHRAALKHGYRTPADRHYVEATLAELARRREAHDQARQVHAPESGTVTRVAQFDFPPNTGTVLVPVAIPTGKLPRKSGTVTGGTVTREEV